MDDRRQNPCTAHGPRCLGYQFLGTGGRVLEVTVRGALGLGHGSQRTHPTVGLVGAALEQFDSPGASSVPANIEPIITALAPATMALDRSPEKRMPPSAIIGTPVPSSAAETLAMAEICGTPTPATMRVVQIEPGPMPTLTASAPALTSPARLRRWRCCRRSPAPAGSSPSPSARDRSRHGNGHGRYPPPPRRRRPQPAPRRGHQCRRRYRPPRRRAGGPGCPDASG